MEDIVTLVDGRPELVNEFARAPEVLRSHVADVFGRWLVELEMDAIVECHLAPDAATQARMPEVLRRFRRMAGLATGAG